MVWLPRVDLEREKYKERVSAAHSGNHSLWLHGHPPRGTGCTGSVKDDWQSPQGIHTKASQDERKKDAQVDPSTTGGSTKSSWKPVMSRNVETTGNTIMVPSFILLKRRSETNTAGLPWTTPRIEVVPTDLCFSYCVEEIPTRSPHQTL